MLSEREKYLVHVGFAAAKHGYATVEAYLAEPGHVENLVDKAPPSDRTVRRVFSRGYARAVALMPTTQQNAILEHLRGTTEPQRTPELAKAFDVSIPHINVQLGRLVASGYLVRYERPKAAGGIEYHYEIAKDV